MIQKHLVVPTSFCLGTTVGKEEWVRAMICNCGERLEAADDERLV
jgi:hypothetical protein